MDVPVRVEGELVVKIDDLPPMALEQVKSALTFNNEDREVAAREKIFGWWDMPAVITLYRIEQRRGGDKVLCLPRGFAAALVTGMAGLGHTVVWDDHRVNVQAAPGYFTPVLLRDYQLAAVIKLIKAQQGFYESPAGSGKTISILGMMSHVQQRSLVIVDKAGLLEQWRTRAATSFGFPMERDDEGRLFASLDGDRTVGKIGENVWEERDLTICLRQTLYSRLWEIDATKWWQNWGLVCFDEGHHLSGETLSELCRRVVALYMPATSATPSKSPTRGLVVHALVGPVVAQTTRNELYERNVLMKSEVRVIKTDFEGLFWPTHEISQSDAEDGKCDVPGCKKTKEHMHRNNYQTILKSLKFDKARNALIAEQIVSERGHIHLVPSRHLNHLEVLHKAVTAAGWDGPVFYLRGEENAAGMSQTIADEIANCDEAIVFSTVADEALDIPPIDRIHVVFPMRQEAGTIQLIGRGERIWPGKTESIIYDYDDGNVEVFAGQAGEREWTYRKQGLNVKELVRA